MSEGQKQPAKRIYWLVVLAVLLAVVGMTISPYGSNNAIALIISGLLFATAFRRIGLFRSTEIYRRWRRSVLLVLLATLIYFGIVPALLQWRRDQMEQRLAFLQEIDHKFDEPGAPWQEGQPISSPHWNLLRLVQLFPQYFNLYVPIGDTRDEEVRIRNSEYIERARQLFPEATINIKWRETASPEISAKPGLD